MEINKYLHDFFNRMNKTNKMVLKLSNILESEVNCEQFFARCVKENIINFVGGDFYTDSSVRNSYFDEFIKCIEVGVLNYTSEEAKMIRDVVNDPKSRDEFGESIFNILKNQPEYPKFVLYDNATVFYEVFMTDPEYRLVYDIDIKDVETMAEIYDEFMELDIDPISCMLIVSEILNIFRDHKDINFEDFAKTVTSNIKSTIEVWNPNVKQENILYFVKTTFKEDDYDHAFPNNAKNKVKKVMSFI